MATAAANPVSELESEEKQQTGAPPQPAPVAVLRVAPVETETEADRPQQSAVRISARVPPPEPPRNASSTVPAIPASGQQQQQPQTQLQQSMPSPPSNGLVPVTFATPAVPAARDQNFRVRTALTKGWRKGKKTRKSVGGGRGPGFTAREVDGLLELLEASVPVTREEWESVRAQHAERFPGTSRSIDSIRRKFAKVYLARGTSTGADGAPPPVVRRAKLVRERMAARAVSLDDEDAAMAQPEVEHMDTMETGGELHEEEVMDGSHHPNTSGSVHHGEAGNGAAMVSQQALESQQPGLDDGNIPVLPPVVSEPIGATASGGGHPSGLVGSVIVAGTTHGMGENVGVVAPGQGRKPNVSGDKVVEAGGNDLASMFKMYMVQEAQRREEERRIRAEERAEQRALEKARQEREDRRSEQFMQLMVVLASKKPEN